MEKNFLYEWQRVIHKLRDEGIITQEQIDQGFEIPMESIYSYEMDRDTIIESFRELNRKVHNTQYDLNGFKKEAWLQYFEENGEPCFEIKTWKNSVCISEVPVEAQGFFRWNRTGLQLCETMLKVRNRKEKNRIMKEEGLTEQEAHKKLISSFSISKRNDIEKMSKILTEIAINFEKYCEQFAVVETEQPQEQPQEEVEESNDGPIVIEAGILNPAVDSITRNGITNKHKKERQSGIDDFSVRDAMYKNLKPSMVIRFKGKDPTSNEVINGMNICYVYENPQNNEGYLIISEPFEGDKSTKCIFLPRDFVQDLQGEGNSLGKTLTDLTQLYLEETLSDFHKEDGTHILYHRGGIEALEAKAKGIIEKYVPGESQSLAVRTAMGKLYGKEALKRILKNRRPTRSGFENAKAAVFGEPIITKEEERTSEE